MKKYATVETLKSTRIFMSAFTWVFLRTETTSRNAMPACMASTRMAPMSKKNTSEPITDCMPFSSSEYFINSLPQRREGHKEILGCYLFSLCVLCAFAVGVSCITFYLYIHFRDRFFS